MSCWARPGERPPRKPSTSAALRTWTSSISKAERRTAETSEIDQEWTIGDLRPSADLIPYQVQGTLWEATATAELEHGGIPVIAGFFARSDADIYPVLWNVASPLAVSPATLPPAGSVTGKFYFDVTGAAPTSVAYRDAEDELVEWRTPAQ